MSVRATERLIGDVVIATGLPNSPLMVVQAIDEGTKMITTTWFSDSHEGQKGLFPASALDRADPPTAKAKPAATKLASAKAAKPAAAKKTGKGRRK